MMFTLKTKLKIFTRCKKQRHQDIRCTIKLKKDSLVEFVIARVTDTNLSLKAQLGNSRCFG